MTEIYVGIAGVLIFAGIGFQRGWLQEVATLGGLLAGWATTLIAGPAVLGLANRLGLMIRFSLAGGFDSTEPAGILRELRETPLIDPAKPGVLLCFLFVALAAASYYAASRWIDGAATTTSRILGVLVAIGNGVVLVYPVLGFLAPIVRSGPADLLVLNPITIILGDYLLSVLLLGVVLAIGIALISSGRIGKRAVPGGSRRPARARASSS